MATRPSQGQWAFRRQARWTVPVAIIGFSLLIAPPSTLAQDAPPGSVLDPPAVTVNGTPIDAEEGHKVEGCSVVVEITGLTATPEAPARVSVAISAVAPTVPEGTTSVLLDEELAAVQATFATEHDMTDLLTGFEPRSNGYRLSVAVSVDGTPMGAKQIWLACGAAQDGHPNRIVFDVRWLGVDGQPFAAPLDSAMAPGWRETYAIQASSIRGTATCSIPQDSEQLVCEYDNPDHGSKPGLVVPGGRQHTYEVVQLGLPDRWAVDASTVGTFLGRETCGTGGCGGDDGGGGHEGGGSCGGHQDAPALTAAADEETAETCTHTVVNRYLGSPAPPPIIPVATTTTTTNTTTTTTTTTTVPTTTTTTTSAPAAVPTTAPPSVLPSDATVPTAPVAPSTGTASLPRTGSATVGLAFLGVALLLSGLTLGATGRAVRDDHPTDERRRP